MSETLRETTGNPAARLHHHRHTVGSRALLNGFTIEDPYERIRQLTTAVADLDHANVRTSLQYYGHATHYAIACRQAIDVEELPNTAIAAILRKNSSAINALRSRYVTGRKLVLSVAKAKHIPSRKPTRLALPNGLSSTSEATEEDLLKWLHRFASGESAQAATSQCAITTSQLLVALKELETVSSQVNWYPVSQERLASEVSALANGSIEPLKTSKEHKRFPSDEFAALIKDASLDQDLSNVIRHHALGLRLAENKPLIWWLSEQALNEVSEALNNHGIPIQLVSDRAPHCYSFVPETSLMEAKHFSNCCRLMLFFLIWRSSAS